MNDELLRDVQSQFSKSELIKIVEELSLSVTGTSTSIIKTVVKDLDENGVPELSSCSDLLAEFLVVAEYIDEYGKLLEQEVEPEKLPDCYGFEDNRDPACRQCKVQEVCRQRRVENRPECFAKAFSKASPECQECIEAMECNYISKK